MSSDRARELRQQGIAAAKAGNKEDARALLQQSIRLEPNSEAAWLWLASVARDNRERLFCLNKVLEINPNNQAARSAVEANTAAETPPPVEAPKIRKLGAPPPEPPPPAPPAAPPPAPRQQSVPPQPQPRTASVSPPSAPPASASPFVTPSARKFSTQEMMNMPPGVPLPSTESVAAAQKQIEVITREYLSPKPSSPVKWVKKAKRRAGEGDVVVLRLYVGAAVFGFLVMLLIVGTVVVLSNDDLRAIVIAPTRTPTRTPTSTSTPTPGLTPTPSPLPRRSPTPSPLPPLELPQADIYNLPGPTDVYPPVFERPLQEAVALIDRGEYAVALPTIEAERALSAQSFTPNPYYFEAMAYLGQGDFDDALDILEEAEERLEEAPNSNFGPLVDSGFAQVYYARALSSFARGDAADGEADLLLAQERAEAAVERDARLDEPYLVLARIFARDREYGDAISMLDQALAIESLAANTTLILEKGEVYYRQREFDLAQYQAFLALYIDPTTEAAYQLQVRTSLAQEVPGQAVLYAQNYLFYYPGSAIAFKLLGDARVAEGNYDLALAAYNQALAGDDGPDTAAVLAARGALYADRGRFNEALADLSRAYDLSDNLVYRAQRMIAAYRAGRFNTVLDDADALIGREVLPDAEISFYTALATFDDAARNDEVSAAVLNTTLGLLNPLLADPDLPDAYLSVAQEYAARVNLANGGPTAALGLIEQAIAAERTAGRVFLRGQIFEAQGEQSAAIRDYEWVQTWGLTYPLTFIGDVEDRLAALSDN